MSSIPPDERLKLVRAGHRSCQLNPPPLRARTRHLSGSFTIEDVEGYGELGRECSWARKWSELARSSSSKPTCDRTSCAHGFVIRRRSSAFLALFREHLARKRSVSPHWCRNCSALSMPYAYELQNRQRVRARAPLGRAPGIPVPAAGVGAGADIGLGGIGLRHLTAPEATVAAVDEPVAMAVAKIRTPPLLEPMTFPAYAEWSDIDAACGDCDGSFSYGIGGDLDPVDNEALSRLEHSSGVGTGSWRRVHGIARRARLEAPRAAGGLGGGGGASSAAAGEAASSERRQTRQRSASEDAESTAGAATAAAVASGPATEGGGSPSGGDSSSGGSSARASRGRCGSASQPPDLILSRITPDSGDLAGPRRWRAAAGRGPGVGRITGRQRNRALGGEPK